MENNKLTGLKLTQWVCNEKVLAHVYMLPRNLHEKRMDCAQIFLQITLYSYSLVMVQTKNNPPIASRTLSASPDEYYNLDKTIGVLNIHHNMKRF